MSGMSVNIGVKYSHGYIVNGGSASNVVPDYAEIEFLSRAPKRSDLSYITDWVHDCAKAAALATKTTVEIAPCGFPFYDLRMSHTAQATMHECFNELGLTDSTEKQNSGSSDIGNVSYVCPAFHPSIGVEKGLLLHTREFANAMTSDNAHKAILTSAKLLVKLAFNLYKNPQKIELLKKDHAACIENDTD